MYETNDEVLDAQAFHASLIGYRRVLHVVTAGMNHETLLSTRERREASHLA
jgi:hypothetical protein